MRIINGPIWLAPFKELDKWMDDGDRFKKYPQDRPAASERFDRFIRELMAEGYTEAEIQGGLETYIFETKAAK